MGFKHQLVEGVQSFIGAYAFMRYTWDIRNATATWRYEVNFDAHIIGYLMSVVFFVIV